MYQRLLVGTDGSPTATRAVEAAAVTASAHGAELVIAHAFVISRADPFPADAPHDDRWRHTPGTIAEQVVERATRAARTAADGNLPIIGRAAVGRPLPVLLAVIDELEVDAVVVGNRDLANPVRARRSVGRALARRAACDVIIVDTIDRRSRRGRAA